jgi:transposase
MRSGRGWGRCWNPGAEPTDEAVRGKIRAKCSTGCCGSWARGRSGASCPSAILRIRPVIAVSNSGCAPARLVGDKAYDSDRLDRDLLHRYGIELIAPHRQPRQRPTQDGRPLRRYRRRWRIERLFAWLHWFRRLVTRWEYHIENFFGMVRLGCIKLLLRYI